MSNVADRALRESHERSERGTTAVLVAGSLFLLMGIAAVAVDWGLATNQVRQDQSAADLAAVAAVQYATGPTKADALSAATTEAKAVAEATLGLGALDWGSCTDSGQLTLTDGTTDCISFSDSLRVARVVIPPIDVDTTFGAVIGVASIETSALAQAGAEYSLAGKVLPFGLPSGLSGQMHVCLRTTAHAGDTEPCDNNSEGNFGVLDISLFGDEDFGTYEACGAMFSEDKLEVNIALGIDHRLTEHDGTDAHDWDVCNDDPFFMSEVNVLPTRTGVGNYLYPGLVGGTTKPQLLVDGSAPGRLVNHPDGYKDDTVLVDSASPEIDDVPLWEALVDYSEVTTTTNPDTGSFYKLPSECDDELVDSSEEMVACLEAFNTGAPTFHDHHLFSLEILQHIRFGAVPELDAADLGPGKSEFNVVGLQPVYLNGTYWKCTGGGPGGGGGGPGGGGPPGGGGGGGSCQIAHFPGESSTGSCTDWSLTSCGLGTNANNGLEALTALVLDRAMLHPSIAATWPDTENAFAINLTR